MLIYRVSEEVGGVYCGLCILLRQLEVEEAVDVVSTMEKIRRQRPASLTSKVSSCCVTEQGMVSL